MIKYITTLFIKDFPLCHLHIWQNVPCLYHAPDLFCPTAIHRIVFYGNYRRPVEFLHWSSLQKIHAEQHFPQLGVLVPKISRLKV